MSLKPGDTFDLFFNSYSSASVLTDVDVSPPTTATMVHNGTDDSGVPLTVTRVSVGRYRISGVVPGSGYASGDSLAVRVNAWVNGKAGELFPLQTVLDGLRVSDLSPTLASIAASAAAAAAGIAALTSAAPIKLVSPILADGSMVLVQGDDYTAALSRAPQWMQANYSGPSVSGLTVSFEVIDACDYEAGIGSVLASLTGSASMSGSTAIFTVDITGSFTAALTGSPPQGASNYIYQMKYTHAGATVTIALDGLTISRRVG